MSLDRRLQAARQSRGDGMPFDPFSASLPAVYRRARQLRFRRRAAQTIAGIAVVLMAALAAPNLFRQLGIQQVETTDNPPTESGGDDGLGTGASRTGDAPGLDVGTGGVRGQAGAEAPRQGGQVQGSAAVPKVPTPVSAGTYSYDASGYFCGFLAGCGSLKDRRDTYERPSGSHQRSTSTWTNSKGKFEAEYGYDFRADGVYWEHFRYTVTDSNGAVADTYACAELSVAPYRVWVAGAEPGDHFEDTRPCNAYYLDSGPGVTIVDILRAETVSIGGREVSTLFVRVEWRRSNGYNITEGWVFPDHYLFVKEDLRWSNEHNNGEYYTMLESMTPS